MMIFFDQLFELTGKLIGSLLDWPFLLFVFLVCILNRYRDQIGSMMDRRGAVGAGELAKAVRRGLEPIQKQVDEIAPAFSELRAEVERIESLHSEKKVAAALAPVSSKIRSLDGAIADLRSELQRLFGKELQQILNRERDSVGQQLGSVKESLEAVRTQVDNAASRDVIDRLESRLEPLSEDLGALREAVGQLDAAMKSVPAELEGRFGAELEGLRQEVAAFRQAMDQVCAQMECAAPREVTDHLQDELDPLVKGLDELRQSVSALDAMLTSAPAELDERFAAHVQPIDRDVAALKQSLESLQGQVQETASREVTDRLQGELDPLAQGIEKLRESVGVLEGAIQSVPTEVEARFSEYLQPITREVASIKESMVQLSTPVAPATAVRPASGEGGTRRPKKQRPRA